MDTKHHEAPARERLEPTNQVLNQRKGTIRHRMEMDGIAKLCIKAPPKFHPHHHHDRAPHHPSYYRFGLRIHTPDEEAMFFEEDVSSEPVNVDKHLTNMEKEMERIERAMKNVLSEADFAKDRDATMHKQFLQMHSTTFYWPVVQVCVLLVTGFTQASHIVQFFKSRRII